MNGNRMNEALIQHAEDDVDRDQCGENEQSFVGKRIVEGRCRALKVGLQAGREVKVLGHFFDVADGRAQRGIWARG